MKRSEFNKMIKSLLKDVEDGYYGMTELMDEIWDHYNNEVMRNKELWKEVKRLRKKLERQTKQ